MIRDTDPPAHVSTPTSAVDRRPRNFTPGLMISAVLLLLYGGLAVSIDYPTVGGGFKSDEATYYMLGHSLA